MLQGADAAKQWLQAGFSVREVWSSGVCNAADMRAAGVSRESMVAAGAGGLDLQKGGYEGVCHYPLPWAAAPLAAVVQLSVEERRRIPFYDGAWASPLVQAVHATTVPR